MTKNTKITLITITVIAVIIAAIAIGRRMSKRKKTAAQLRMEDLQSQMRIPKDVNTITTNVTGNAVENRPLTVAEKQWLFMHGGGTAINNTTSTW